MQDSRYDTDDYIYGVKPNDFLVENLHHIPKGHVLCLADGEGRNSVYLAQQGYQVTAVDYSSHAIEKAKKLAAKADVFVNYVCADLNDYTMTQQEVAKEAMNNQEFSAIVSIFAHFPPALRNRLHEVIPTLLKSQGVYLVESYTPKQLDYNTGGPKRAELMLSESILRTELPSLEFVQLREIERDVIEGSRHTGLSAVVQAIAKKH